MAEPPAESSKRAPPPTGYLYHQQTPEPPARSSRKSNAPARKPKPSSASNLGQKYFLANLRTFLVVLAGMGLVLGLAYFVNQQYTRHVQRKVTQNVQQHILEDNRPGDAKPASTPGILSDPADGEGGPETDLRTDNIRKSLYLARLADVAFKEKDYKTAITRYQEALALSPYLHRIWADLGAAYLESSEPGHARVALERAVQGDATNPQVLCNLGLSYMQLKYSDKALELFESALDVDPGFPRTHFYLAKLYLARKEYEPAMVSLERYLRAVPTDCEALREKSFILAGRGQYHSALDSIRRALAECPDKAELYWDAAAVCALLQRADDAIRYLERGETFTSPREAYRIYLNYPAFAGLRNNASGKIYEKELADRARRYLREGQE